MLMQNIGVTNKEHYGMLWYFLEWSIECFHLRGQHLCKFIRTKESVRIRKEFNSQKIGLGHQHGRRFIVWDTNMAAVTSCENNIVWVCKCCVEIALDRRAGRPFISPFHDSHTAGNFGRALEGFTKFLIEIFKQLSWVGWWKRCFPLLYSKSFVCRYGQTLCMFWSGV